jgi:hypothetical protein
MAASLAVDEGTANVSASDASAGVMPITPVIDHAIHP